MHNEFSKSDKIIVFISSFVAITALIVSVWQGVEMRKHNRLSVKPLLNFTRNYSDRFDLINNDTIQTKQYQLIIANNGTGPAIIKSFELYYKNKIINAKKGDLVWSEYVNLIQDNINVKQASSYDTEDVILHGASKSLIRCDIIGNHLQNTKLIIRYESIYQEEFSKEIVLID